VLVTGESGTGKELAARMLHEQSPRVDGPFVPLHCAALPDTLLESELFGHEKGSFTGAHSRRRGKLEEADGGTVFLDEIGEISPATQVKLLRFLQTNSIERVGGNETLHLDVRIVAATNRDLAKEVREGRFREDLYYRLNVINIEMPPLRTRTGDIALLIRHFTTKYALENQKTIDEIAPAFLHALEQHEWPGNVRELENIVERAVVLAQGSSLEVAHLPAVLGHAELGHNISEHIQIPGATLAALERYAILRTYEATGGDTRRTSEILAISQRKVQYKLREYSEE
ncbi:MAG: sigma-54 dependent transcriptional regulator, partial [Myxococcota bacterium]